MAPPLPENAVWVWWAFLCFIGLFNSVFYYRTFTKRDPAEDDKYARLMRWLALPFVFECAYRGVLPNIYCPRVVLFDTPFSSILLERMFAFVGELCWVSQIALALITINKSINGHSTIYTVSVLAVFFCFCAECFSVNCTATKNNINCALESSLWMSAFALFLPCALSTYLRTRNMGESAVSAKIFSLVLFLYALFYVPYEWFVDVPMYVQRWRDDRANGVVYLSFTDGMKDAAFTRVHDTTIETWQPEMFWMAAYFSLGVWSSILLVNAPRIDVGYEGASSLAEDIEDKGENKSSYKVKALVVGGTVNLLNEPLV